MKKFWIFALLALVAGGINLAGAQPAPGGKMGDLGPYRLIAADVLTLVDKPDAPGAVTRIKDLETLWDRNARNLTPKSPADWHRIDVALDKALQEVRAGKPSQAACHQALTVLIGAIDQVK